MKARFKVHKVDHVWRFHMDNLQKRIFSVLPDIGFGFAKLAEKEDRKCNFLKTAIILTRIMKAVLDVTENLCPWTYSSLYSI
jgi:hypothetical protein